MNNVVILEKGDILRQKSALRQLVAEYGDSWRLKVFKDPDRAKTFVQFMKYSGVSSWYAVVREPLRGTEYIVTIDDKNPNKVLKALGNWKLE